jgi:hypothetical protein
VTGVAGVTGVADPMPWRLSHRKDPEARAVADRHYNRQRVGAADFVPPGRCLVLKTPGAFWVTSWPLAEYVRHRWAGAWVCSAFRREPECPHVSSDLIRAAVAATRWKWPDAPELGMVTFVDERKVKAKRDPGYCYLMAGFEYEPDATAPDGYARTEQARLRVLRMPPGAMPAPAPPRPPGAFDQTALWADG